MLAKRKNNKLRNTLICSTTLIILTLFLLIEDKRIWINTSSSLPIGIYVATPSYDASFKKGDLVVSCLPSQYAKIAKERKYVNFGTCNFDTAPIGKRVVALEGDHVKISPMGVYVNGIYINNSLPKTYDKEGQKLESFVFDRKLYANEILLINEKEDSFDGRYFGVIDKDRVIRKVSSLFTI